MSNTLVINASRARSGGAVSHIKGIISNFDKKNSVFDKVILFTYESLALELKNNENIIIFSPKQINKGLIYQLYWEKFILPVYLKKFKKVLLLNVDAGSVCNFKPSVVISQDLLSFEPGEMKRYGLSKQRIRLSILKWVQKKSFYNSQGIIFLTKYAQNLICKSKKELLDKSTVIHHGIDKPFFHIKQKSVNLNVTKIIYVSNLAPYKHHNNILKCIDLIPMKYGKLEFKFVGGGTTKQINNIYNLEKKILRKKIKINLYGFTNQKKLIKFYENSDLILFASSCENMPITLMEGMATGLPLICSNRGPMPEMLGNTGIYFDPENPKSIAKAIIGALQSFQNSQNTLKDRAKVWTWDKCSKDTFTYLEKIWTEKIVI